MARSIFTLITIFMIMGEARAGRDREGKDKDYWRADSWSGRGGEKNKRQYDWSGSSGRQTQQTVRIEIARPEDQANDKGKKRGKKDKRRRERDSSEDDSSSSSSRSTRPRGKKDKKANNDAREWRAAAEQAQMQLRLWERMGAAAATPVLPPPLPLANTTTPGTTPKPDAMDPVALAAAAAVARVSGAAAPGAAKLAPAIRDMVKWWISAHVEIALSENATWTDVENAFRATNKRNMLRVLTRMTVAVGDIPEDFDEREDIAVKWLQKRAGAGQ